MIALQTPLWHAVRPTTDQIINSKIVARATIKADDGTTTIICAFQLSYQYKFWFTFRAKTARSPRRTWKFLRYAIVYQGELMTLDAIIKRSNLVGTISKRYPVGKRNFEKHLQHTAYPTKDAAALAPVADPKKFEYVNRRMAMGRGGRTAILAAMSQNHR